MKALLALLFEGALLKNLLVAGGSMLLSLGVYAAAWGWRFAAGFVALLLAHELGHYVAAQQRGLHVGLPTFIPFVGAWIELKEKPLSVETEAYVALAGPVVGSMAALAVYFAARNLDSDLLLAISYAGFFLNLLNLLPVSPLDGGRITAIVSPRVWLLGAPALVAAFFYLRSPVLLLVALIAFPQLKRAWHYDAKAPENERYYGVPAAMKVEYAALYLGLAGLLSIMTYDVHQMLGGWRGE